MEEATPRASEGGPLGQEVRLLHQGGFLLLCIPSPPFLPFLLPSFLFLFLPFLLPTVACSLALTLYSFFFSLPPIPLSPVSSQLSLQIGRKLRVELSGWREAGLPPGCCSGYPN